MHLQQFKGMRSTKLGMRDRGTVCQQEVYERGTFSVKNGLASSRDGASQYETLLSILPDLVLQLSPLFST